MQKVNLSGCPQMTSAILLLSVLDSLHCLDPTSRKIFECLDKDQSRSPLGFLPILSFEAVQEVNICKCHALHLESAVECFSKSFPSLRTIKAAYHLDFKTLNLHKLVQKCPMLCEVDLTVDPSPVIPTKVSVVSSSSALMPLVLNKSIAGDSSLYATSVYHSGPSPSKITKLTLEGRSDMCGELLLCVFACITFHTLDKMIFFFFPSENILSCSCHGGSSTHIFTCCNDKVLRIILHNQTNLTKSFKQLTYCFGIGLVN